MKHKRYIINVVVAIGLMADILQIASILPNIEPGIQIPEPTPYEISLDLSFSMEVKSMK